ncbi:MAG: CPBP family intramembrane metalloprotease [Alphaproteobacteria bacterium]|nr:MAG: CPBP family intramembrane metalloprotease [Alphaproteobacteria bacterium]
MSPAFEAYLAPARARPQLWRLILGVILCALVYAGYVGALVGLVAWVAGPQAGAILSGMARGTTPLGALLLLASFLGMALGPVIAVRLLHGRRAGTLFGPVGRVVLDFVVAAVVVVIMSGLSVALWRQSFVPEPGLPLDLWLRLLPLALLGVLIQTGAEELLFRGYLLQQLAVRFRRRIAWMVVPSLVFGALHYDPAAGDAALLVVAAAALFGLIAADLVAATGSLGAAWGFHFANNVFAILVLATKGTIPGLALWLTPYEARDIAALGPMVLHDLAAMAAAWLLVRLLLTR